MLSINLFNNIKSSTALSLALLVGLSACTSSGGGGVLDSAGSKKKTSEEEILDLRAYCPKTTIRAGTETMRVYAKGVKKEDEGSSKKLRFQATIQEVVRECNYIAETLTIRVGVAGRVINGPTGEVGALELPIRIAVTRGDDVLYSQLHKIQTLIEASRGNATFRFVDEAVNIDKPTKQNIIIHVGFDEGPYDTK